MGADGQGRRCRCGTRLARDNRSSLCNACTKAARNHRLQPPAVPLEFWQTPDMRAALAACDMGAVMRAFRTHPFHGRAISQEVAAGWVGITQTRLSRIEIGSQLTDLTKLMHWAHVLQVPTDLLWFRMPSASSTPNAVQATRQDVEGPAEQHDKALQPTSGALLLPVIVDGRPVLVPLDAKTIAASELGSLLDGRVMTGYPSGEVASATEWEAMPLSRRSLLTRGIAAAALPTLGLDEAEHVAKALADARSYLDGDVVAYFSRQIDAAMANDGAVGPRKTLPLMLGILDAIKHCARDARPNVRCELLSVGARGAEFAGWLYRDVHDQATASFWHDRATEWAQVAGDLPMQGYVLLKKAQMAYDDRDAVNVLGFAQAAQNGPWRLPPKVRAEVAQQEARGLAMLGEPMFDVERKVEESREHFARGAGLANSSQLGAYFNDHTLQLRTASCYIEAGEPQRAAALYGEVLGSGTLSQRDQGYFLARRASALAQSGEPDDAAAVGLESIAVATATSSARTRRELSRTVNTLQPWNSRPGPRALREALAAN